MIGYLYHIRNTETNDVYVGSSHNVIKRKKWHFSHLEKGTHHSILLQRAYSKYGKDKFVFEVLNTVEVSTDKELKVFEQNLLDTQQCRYNVSRVASGGDKLSYHPNKLEICMRRSKSFRKMFNILTTEERSRLWGRHGIENGMYGKTHTDEVKSFLSENTKQKSRTKELRLGKTNKEIFGSEKAVKISKQLSDYGKERVGSKNPFYGKHHTNEFKQQSSIKRVERYQNMSIEDKLNHVQFKPIMVDDHIYYSCSDAARVLNCTPGNITYKLKSEKHPNYRYLNKHELKVLKMEVSV